MNKSLYREIGSEFWSVPQCECENGIFPAGITWHLSGRTALSRILDDLCQKYDVKKAAVPSWCCDSMIIPFSEHGLEVSFYTVCPDAEGGLQQRSDTDADVVLAMEYFGYKAGCSPEWDDRIVIRDVTHSLLADREDPHLFTKASYTFGSLRKWAGFYTGGFAYARDGSAIGPGPDGGEEYIALRESAMRQKKEYLDGYTDTKEYLSVFEHAETLLEAMPSCAASARDIHAALHMDVQGMVSTRRENAQLLLDTFSDMAIFPKLAPHDVPLFVPVLVPGGKRDALRRHLIQQDIYCPCHWPLSPYHPQTDSPLYHDELSLVCDQRYTQDDMLRMCEAIRKLI